MVSSNQGKSEDTLGLMEKSPGSSIKRGRKLQPLISLVLDCSYGLHKRYGVSGKLACRGKRNEGEVGIS